jgi:hypothetical protein
MDESEKFDGFYILPGEDDGIKLSYFDFKDDFAAKMDADWAEQMEKADLND